MSERINHDAKEVAIEAIKEHGTMQAGAKAAGVSTKTLNNEMNRSAIFKRRILEAREEGKRNMSDNALQLVKDYADGKYEKTDRNRLTAALSILNWSEPGFRGTQTVQGQIDHNVRVITAVPRPKYNEIESPKVKVLPSEHSESNKKEREKLRQLNRGDTIEEVIEGEVIDR